MAITVSGDISLQHLTFVINGAPEVVKLSVDFDEDLVEVPGPVRKFLTGYPPLADLRREHRPEAVPPKSNGLVRDIDAAFVEQVLDIPQRRWKADVHHHRKANYLGRSLEIFECIAHRGRLGNRALALSQF